MKNLKKNFGKYFAEFLVVAFGVFLGMYVNEWQNDKKLNKNKEKAIQNIITELESNKEKLEKSVDYHELIKVNLDTTFSKVPNNEKFLFEKYLGNKNFKYVNIKDWTGVNFPEFDFTAFEVAKMNGILQDINIDLVQEISKNYNKTKQLQDFQKIIVNRMGSLNSESKVIDVIMDIKLITGDNLGMEKGLLERTKETIKVIKNRKK